MSNNTLYNNNTSNIQLISSAEIAEKESIAVYKQLPKAFKDVEISANFIGMELKELLDPEKHKDLAQNLKAAGFDNAEFIAKTARELAQYGGKMCESRLRTSLTFKRDQVKGPLKSSVFCLGEPEWLESEKANTYIDLKKILETSADNYNKIIASGESEKARFLEKHPELKEMVNLVEHNDFPDSIPHILLSKTKAEPGYNNEIIFNAYNHGSVLNTTFMHNDIFNVLTTEYTPGFTIYLSDVAKKDDDLAVTFPDSEIYMVLPSKASEITRAGIVHEAAHSMFHMLFANACKPFGKWDYTMNEAYIKAERNTLDKLIDILGLVDESANLSSYSNRDLIELIKTKSSLSLLLFKDAYKQICKDEIISVKLSDEVKQHISKYSDKTEEELSHLYQLPEKEQVQEFTKIAANIYQAHIKDINDLNSKFGDKQIVEKIWDFIYRSPHEYEAELIVRVPELFTLGVQEELINNYFSEMISFWKTNISPEVTKYIEENTEYLNSALQFEDTPLIIDSKEII